MHPKLISKTWFQRWDGSIEVPDTACCRLQAWLGWFYGNQYCEFPKFETVSTIMPFPRGWKFPVPNYTAGVLWGNYLTPPACVEIRWALLHTREFVARELAPSLV